MKKFLFIVFTLFISYCFAVDIYDSVVIGGGPGAVTSALYMARSGIDPLVIEGKEPGGLIAKSHLVQNWPGEKEIAGFDLSLKLREQAEKNGCAFVSEEVVAVDFSKRPYRLTLKKVGTSKKREILAESVIISMGSKPNKLGIGGEEEFWGRGVTNCAVCDGPLYKNKTVAIVGGGDSALIEADFLSKIAKDVHIFVRKDHFRTVEENRKKRILDQKNVHVHFKCELKEIIGNKDHITSILVSTPKGRKNYRMDGVFLAIGSTPNTEIFKGELDLDARGYIELFDDQETSKEGVYAVGDICDPFYKQAISAAGDGAKAAIQSQRFLAFTETKHLAKAEIKHKYKLVEISSASEFDKLLEESSLPVLVDFYATWCGPCRNLTPFIERAAADLSGNFVVVKVNIEKCPELTKRYGIYSIPTLLSFDDKSLVETKIGSDAIRDYIGELE